MGIAFGLIVGYAMSTLFTAWQFKRLNNAAAYENLAFQIREALNDPNVPIEHHDALDLAAVALQWGVPEKAAENGSLESSPGDPG